MSHTGQRSWQYDRMKSDWPKTLAALESTWLTGQGWYKTSITGQNDAGYLLACLGKYEAKGLDLLGHRGVTRGELDCAAAAEILYKWQQRPQFRNCVHALAACIIALPIERPQRITQWVRRTLVSQTRNQIDIPVKGPYA